MRSGRLNTGSYLNRLPDATLQSRNNTKACPPSLPRPAGLSCDGYPFQSTQQGCE